MKITFYLYNAFIVESESARIALDPGAFFLYYFRLNSLIPKEKWPSISHILVTHGDPDHYWHADSVAKASGAEVLCHEAMVRKKGNQILALGPRTRGLVFDTIFPKLHTLREDESIQVGPLNVRGIQTTHGPLTIRIGRWAKTMRPGPEERIGWGALGFEIMIDGYRLVNLGDTLLEEKAWSELYAPDVLMIPIGGKTIHNTMDEEEALNAVRLIQPKLVIPCHYNCPFLFNKKGNPADGERFQQRVREMGADCLLLRRGESVEI